MLLSATRRFAQSDKSYLVSFWKDHMTSGRSREMSSELGVSDQSIKIQKIKTLFSKLPSIECEMRKIIYLSLGLVYVTSPD